MMSQVDVHWPAKFEPARSALWVRNEITTSSKPEDIWLQLISAPLWPTFYSNASQVYLEDDESVLAMGTRFRWKTFGLSMSSEVMEFVPNKRIAWTAKGVLIQAYHAWLLRPLPEGGFHITTEESQLGLLPRLGKLFAVQKRIHRQHQLWLEGLDHSTRRTPLSPETRPK